MDTSRQLHEADARGWRRGLYDDVKRTFRAPIVNWIFRTAVANEPAFTRYAWGQVKPLFETRGFARLSVDYRDAVLTAMDADGPLPGYRPGALGLAPEAFAELRGQLATYDVVAPRLAVLFETMDRALHDEPVGTAVPDERWATAPFPARLDRDRGRPPTLIDAGDLDPALADTVARIRAFHGFEGSLPSIYRTLAQWPPFLEPLWDDLEPRFEGAAFDDAVERTGRLVDEYVDAAPYRPALAPADLRRAGFEDGVITDVQDLFRSFNTGPVETVLPALGVFAATVGSDGERALV